MRTTISCAGCDREVADAGARWCGHCGHPLTAPEGERRPTRTPAAVAPVPLDAPDDGSVDEAELRTPMTRRSRLVGAAVVTVVLGGLLGAQATRQVPAEPHGYTDRGVPARTGVAAVEAIERPDSVAWQAALDLPGLVPAGTVVRGGDELVHVLDLGGRQGVTAHDAATGAVRWSRPDLALADTGPLLAGEVLVVGTRDGAHVGLGSDGTTRWTLTGGLAGPAAVPAGIVDIRGSATVSLHDPATGEPTWEVALADELDASVQYVVPGAPEDLIVVLASRPRGLRLGSNPELEAGLLVGLEASTGEIRWSVDLLPGLAWFQTPVAVDDEVAVAASAAEVAFWDVATGRRLGRFDRSLTFPPLWVGATSGGALLLEPAGTLTAVGSDGRARWTVETTLPAEVAVRGDRVLLSTDSRITVLDATSGTAAGGLPVGSADRRGPPGSDGAAYALRPDGRLIAYEPTGGIRFTRETLVPAAAAPAVADDALYTATGSGISVLAAEDGRRVWEFRSGDPAASIAGDLYTPVVDEDVVIVSPPRSQPLEVGGIFALQRSTGILAWDRLTDRPSPRGPLTFDRDLAVLPVEGELHGHAPNGGRRALAAVAHGRRGPIAAGGGLLVAATAPGDPGRAEGRTVIAVRRADRGRVWETPVEACTPPSIADDLVLVGTAGGLRALDLLTGSRRWDVPTSRPVCGELVVGTDLVVGVAGGVELVAVQRVDGAPAWQRVLEDAVAAPPSLAGGELLVPLLDGTVVGLDATDGETTWRVALGGVPASSPVVADGRLVVLLRDGRLVALTAG